MNVRKSIKRSIAVAQRIVNDENSALFKAGFQWGFRDGKGHKKKIVKSQDSADKFVRGYVAGYKAGRSNK